MKADFDVILNFNSATPVKTGAEFKAGDKGFTINMDVRELDPTGMTPKIAFYRSNGTSVESSAVTNVGNIFSYTLLGNELAVPGIVVADLKFYDGDDQRISSASFIFTAIADTLDGLGGGAESYSDELEQLSEEFEETLQEYKDAFGEVGVINPKGDYDSSEEYVAFDLVSYQGSSWVCREGCQGETPSTSSSYWQLWAAKGDAGPAGQDGADGRGIKSMAKDASNHLIITYDDDQTEDAGLLPAGPAGQDGQDGDDGRGISSMTINGSGHLIITYDDSTTEDAGVIPGGGGGLYPHVIVISDTGSTVTLVKGATTVNASETSTGHFEADVPDYGTWTIHSVLSGDDATVNLNVDDVKVYTVDDSHFAASITVTYPNGATCAISATGLSPIYATGSPYTFTVHSAATYTITATIDGISKTDSVTITTAGQTEAVTIEYGTINLTYDAAFQGETITCINGGTTITKTAPSAGTTMTFRPPTTGTWTISGEVGGVTFSTSATVASLSTAVSATLAATPDGSTVTPTDDVETLLHCANIWDKNYSTIAEVIADSQTLLAVISSNNAVDYLVRSTTFRTAICADALAMLYIGQYNYCADTLLANTTWRTAICDSEYFELVLTGQVPKMTGYNTPSGVATSDNENTPDQIAWRAFDGNDSDTMWGGKTETYPMSLTYQFPTAKCIKAIDVKPLQSETTSCRLKNFKIFASNDNFATSVELFSGLFVPPAGHVRFSFDNQNSYTYYRLSGYDSYGSMVKIMSLQYYAREDVIPPSTRSLKTFAAANEAEILEMICKADRGEIDLYDDAGWRCNQEQSIDVGIIGVGTYNPNYSVGESQPAHTATIVLSNHGGVELVNSVLDKQGQTRTQCSFEYDLKNCFPEKGYMNSSATNSGMWDSCARRSWCNYGLRNAVSPYIRAATKQFKTITAASYNGNTLQTSNDYYALRARKEVWGSGGNQTEADALTQKTYYQTSSNIIKERGGAAEPYYIRSAPTNSASQFIIALADGSVSIGNANVALGIAPFGAF